MTDNGLEEGTLVVSEGKIEATIPGPLRSIDLPLQDYGDWVIMPGVIDSHVHINEPGRLEWEGFETATKAAAAGGITTLVDMPLNSSPVTTSAAALNLKIAASENKLFVHCGFHGGLIPGSDPELEPLMSEGVFGIKAFLTHSGIDEFPNVQERHLRKAIPLLKKYNLPLLVHAELDTPHTDLIRLEQNPTSYQAYLASRPKEWEDQAINMLIRLSKEFDQHIHIVHLSSANSITAIKNAKDQGCPITTETCPHYLFFNAEEIPDRATVFKCAPPIREKENNILLWHAIEEKVIDFIVTDHSPSPPEMKALDSGNFKKAWGGIAGLQFSLSAVWTKAIERGLSMEEISQLMSLNVAKFLKLDHRKGKLSPGYDADLVVWDPEGQFKVKEGNIYHRHKLTPYNGLTLNGPVKATYVNGYKVYDQGTFSSPEGSMVLKSKNEQSH